MITHYDLRDPQHVRDPMTPSGPLIVGHSLASSSQSTRSYFAAATAAARTLHRVSGRSSDPLMRLQCGVLKDTSRTASTASAQWDTTDAALQGSASSLMQAVAACDAESIIPQPYLPSAGEWIEPSEELTKVASGMRDAKAATLKFRVDSEMQRTSECSFARAPLVWPSARCGSICRE